MAHRPRLKKGDQVHYPGDPEDLGTVIEQVTCPRSTFSLKTTPEERIIIRWDQKQPGCHEHDLDEATRRGRLLTGTDGDNPMYVVRVEEQESSRMDP